MLTLTQRTDYYILVKCFSNNLNTILNILKTIMKRIKIIL